METPVGFRECTGRRVNRKQMEITLVKQKKALLSEGSHCWDPAAHLGEPGHSIALKMGICLERRVLIFKKWGGEVEICHHR